MMTIEKAQKDFNELVEKYGFTVAATTTDTNNKVYHRVWKKKVDVLWHGEMEETLEIRILLSYQYPLMTVIKNGKTQGFIRDYSSPKRAFNAIREIVRCADFEM